MINDFYIKLLHIMVNMILYIWLFIVKFLQYFIKLYFLLKNIDFMIVMRKNTFVVLAFIYKAYQYKPRFVL